MTVEPPHAFTDFLARLDPELTPVVTQLPIRDYSDIPGTRETIAKVLADARAAWEPPTDVERSDHLVAREGGPAVPVRVYRPTGSDELPCLYWIHGGGHVLGSIDQDDAALSHIVTAVNCVAVSVEWRQSPEHPYPAEPDDCYAGLRWVFEHAGDLGVDRDRIAIGGASSGGGTAAAIALRARADPGIDLVFQLLVYPMLDDRSSTPSSRAITYPTVWNTTSNSLAWRAYLSEVDGEPPPYAAPARATDLTGLPPAFVAVGDLDLFLDEDLGYARRLLETGVPTELHVYPGAVHGFDSFAPGAGITRRFVRDRDDALRSALHPEAP